MKKNNILSVLWFISFCLLGYATSMFAGDKVTEEYIVKINNIKMERSSAENLFRYIADANHGVVEARDTSDSNILVRTVTKNMDAIIDSGLMDIVSEVYKNSLTGRENNLKILIDNERTRCVLSRQGKKINMCIDKENEVVIRLLIFN